jgi:hypothetical protein
MHSTYRSVGTYNHVITFNNNEHYGWLTYNSRQKRDKLGTVSSALSVELLFD